MKYPLIFVDYTTKTKKNATLTSGDDFGSGTRI